MDAPDILLVACVKSKRRKPCAAKDLYVSTLFAKQRSYAEDAGIPWFILSAEYGLVAPDEWLSPYERYLRSTPAAFRSAWGTWVAARLELLAGSLVGKVIEVHAGSAYIDAICPHLEARGATLLDPLRGLSMGARLRWYGTAIKSKAPALGPQDSDVLTSLRDENAAATPDEFLAAGKDQFDRPGLYSWWVDREGAATLSSGLGLPFTPGLIYAGLAGATRWPSGQESQSTLWMRITTMHLAGTHEFSTFRRTLGAILAADVGSTSIDETALSLWMKRHLKVVTVPFDDRDQLGKLEKRILTELDPPLNLQGMSPTPIRRRLKELRRAVTIAPGG